MKKSSIRFGQLRRYLADMDFSEMREKAGWRFEHPGSKTVFLFRPYRPSDLVFEHDLFMVRSQLDGRGMVAAEAFADSLEKTPA
jgi:hypothetical protein